MAAKFSFFPLLLAAVALCYFSQAEAGGSEVVIHFICAVPSGSDPVSLGVSGGADAQPQLSSGQNYEIEADANNIVHVLANYGMKFTYFDAYVPSRDNGQAAVYWRIDHWGFAISYDNTNFKNVAPWETE